MVDFKNHQDYINEKKQQEISQVSFNQSNNQPGPNTQYNLYDYQQETIKNLIIAFTIIIIVIIICITIERIYNNKK